VRRDAVLVTGESPRGAGGFKRTRPVHFAAVSIAAQACFIRAGIANEVAKTQGD